MYEDDYEYDGYGADGYGAYDPPDDDATLWAMLAHLLTLTSFIGVPLASFLAPLLVLLVKGKEHEFIDYHARESLNFQISVFINILIAALLSVILIGIPILLALIIMDVVCTIKAGIAARNGDYYEYPWTYRFL